MTLGFVPLDHEDAAQEASRPLAELRADCAELASVRAVWRDHEEWTGSRYDKRWLELRRMRNEVAERIVCSTIAGRPHSGDRISESLALIDAPRPGSWFGDEGADGRMLDQQQADVLIRSQLWSHASGSAAGFVANHAELEGILGPLQQIELAMSQGNADRPRAHTFVARQQRGGISSDPLVRLLAFRAWGDRDQHWFEDRGVRKGEWVAIHREMVVLAWPGEAAMGKAATDARPGERVTVSWNGGRSTAGNIRVSDRLRTPPADYRPGHA